MKTTLLSLALAVTFTLPATAQDVGDMAVIDILPGWRTDNGTHMAALRVQLAPGWKTYWRAPGDAGIPAYFDWRGSDNLAGVTLHWPVPEVFVQNGLNAIGYKTQVVIPMELRPRDPSREITLDGAIDIGVCQDICVPISAPLSAKLLPESSPGAAHRDARIRAALADRPMTRAEAQVGQVSCSVNPAQRGITITASIPMPTLGGNEYAVFELPGTDVWVSPAIAHRAGGTLTASADVLSQSAVAFDRSKLRITVLGRNGAVDIQGCG